jgi:hypothetical protein
MCRNGNRFMQMAAAAHRRLTAPMDVMRVLRHALLCVCFSMGRYLIRKSKDESPTVGSTGAAYMQGWVRSCGP